MLWRMESCWLRSSARRKRTNLQNLRMCRKGMWGADLGLRESFKSLPKRHLDLKEPGDFPSHFRLKIDSRGAWIKKILRLRTVGTESSRGAEGLKIGRLSRSPCIYQRSTSSPITSPRSLFGSLNTCSQVQDSSLFLCRNWMAILCRLKAILRHSESQTNREKTSKKKTIPKTKDPTEKTVREFPSIIANESEE